VGIARLAVEDPARAEALPFGIGSSAPQREPEQRRPAETPHRADPLRLQADSVELIGRGSAISGATAGAGQRRVVGDGDGEPLAAAEPDPLEHERSRLLEQVDANQQAPSHGGHRRSPSRQWSIPRPGQRTTPPGATLDAAAGAPAEVAAPGLPAASHAAGPAGGTRSSTARAAVTLKGGAVG